MFYHELSGPILQVSLEQILVQLPENMRDRASKYKSKRSALNFFQGRQLLSQGLNYLDVKANLSSMTYDVNGKPVLDGVEFNISHSHHIAVCAFSSNGPVGIDIEYPSDLHLPHLKHNFTKPEWDAIQTDMSYPDLFYKLWTRKESIIKATGHTLADLHKIQINSFDSIVKVSKQDWHLQDLSISENCFAALCTNCPIDIIEYIPCKINMV